MSIWPTNSILEANYVPSPESMLNSLNFEAISDLYDSFRMLQLQHGLFNDSIISGVIGIPEGVVKSESPGFGRSMERSMVVSQWYLN
jgi:hypothetical protein